MAVDLIDSTGSVQGDRDGEKQGAALAIINRDEGILFSPKFSTETVRPRRQRTLNRTQNFCKGEDVTDNGSKNYEIHVTGRLVGPEKEELMEVIDSSSAMDFTSAAWSGEVRAKEAEFEGPVGWNPQSGYYHYSYTADFVSTGAGFRDSSRGNGIISDGDSALSGSDGTGLTQ